MTNPLVSVNIPVYNGEKYIKEAIQSILDQTYNNFELIVINDGSTDKSDEIIKSFSDNRIKYFTNKINKGVAFTRNKGLELSDGKYIAILDADDIALPTRLEKQVNYLEKNRQIGLLGSLVMMFNDTGDIATLCDAHNSNRLEAIMLFENQFAQSSVMMRKKALPDEWYKKEFPPAEDYELFRRIAMDNEVANYNEILVKYRVNPEGISADTPKMRNSIHLIHKEQLARLGIKATQKELYLHFNLAKHKYNSKEFTFQEVDLWLSKINRANKKHKVFHVKELRIIIYSKWFKSYNQIVSDNKTKKYLLHSKLLNNTNKFTIFFNSLYGKFKTYVDNKIAKYIFKTFTFWSLRIIRLKLLFLPAIKPRKTEKRIAIISESAPPLGWGGISTAHYNLYLDLKKKGEIVKIFTFNEVDLEYKNEGDIIRHGNKNAPFQSIIQKINKYSILHYGIVDNGRKGDQFIRIFMAWYGAYRLNKSLRKFAPSEIIIQDHRAPLFFLKTDAKCKKTLVSHHNPMRFVNNDLFKDNSVVDAKYAVQIEQKCLKQVDEVICPSQYMKKVFETTYNFSGNIVVKHNIIDREFINKIERKDIRKDYILKKDTFLIYIPTPGSKLKGADFIPYIIKNLDREIENNKIDIALYCTGNIPQTLLIDWEKLSKNVKIIAPGYLSNSQNIAYIKSCDLCVSPTLVENYSMALLEAKYCGIPIVTFDVGGNKEIVTNSDLGFIVEYQNFITLLHTIQNYLSKQNQGKHNKIYT